MDPVTHYLPVRFSCFLFPVYMVQSRCYRFCLFYSYLVISPYPYTYYESKPYESRITIYDRLEVRTIGMCMFGKAFGNKQGIDPVSRDPTHPHRVGGIREDGRLQRGLESANLNVHDG